jgi:hypothetical protein
MCLTYVILVSHSPSCFLDPWASRTHDPSFCIFCMPVPDNDIQYAHCLLFVPAQSAILPLCESEFKHMGPKGCVSCWTAPQPLEASVYWLLEALLFCLTQVHSLGSPAGDSLYRFSFCSGAPVSNDSWWLLYPQQRGCQQSGQEELH